MPYFKLPMMEILDHVADHPHTIDIAEVKLQSEHILFESKFFEKENESDDFVRITIYNTPNNVAPDNSNFGDSIQLTLRVGNFRKLLSAKTPFKNPVAEINYLHDDRQNTINLEAEIVQNKHFSTTLDFTATEYEDNIYNSAKEIIKNGKTLSTKKYITEFNDVIAEANGYNTNTP